MSKYTETALQELAVPVPAAYFRQVSFGYSKNDQHNSNFDVDTKHDIHSSTTDFDSLKSKDEERDEQDVSTGKMQKSVLIFLWDSRIYIRVLAILIMVVSLSLILTAVIMFEKAQNTLGHPLDAVPKPATITDHPCLVFTGITAVNLLLSVAILSLSCTSSKVSLIEYSSRWP
jgi:hypothetical protein